MTDLKKRLRPMEQVDAPDLWEDIERRRPAPQPEKQESSWRRVGIVLAALVIAVAALALTVTAFSGREDRPNSSPTIAPSLARNGVIAYGSIGHEGLFWTVEPDGSHRSVVHVDVPGFVGVPSWSPDGTRIAFTLQSYDDPHPEGGNYDIYTASADGSDPIRLTHDQNDRSPVWSPDGSRIAYIRESSTLQIWVMNADGSDARRLTQGGDAVFPSWSPDGSQIAFVSWDDTNANIYVMNADGTDVRRLTHDPAHEDTPAWSPDGRTIAFASEGGSRDPGIYTMAPDGTGVSELLSDPDPANLGFAWSPDGASMAVVSIRGPGNERTLYVLNMASREFTAIADPGAYFGPSWQPLPTTTGPAPDGGTYEDPANAFSVQVPPGWQRADRPLTHLIDPVEIFSAGTFAMMPGGACAQFPTNAVADMGPHDAFVTILERKRLDPTVAQGPPRPASFGPEDGTSNSEVNQCLGTAKAFFDRWIGFSDQGREFSVFVAMGPDVSDQRRAETWAMLDSLAFDPLPARSDATTWTTSMVSVGGPAVVSDANGRSWVLVEVDSVPASFQAEGPVPLCDDGSAGAVEIVGDHQAIRLTCPNGLQASWFGEGSPWDGNPPGYRGSLGTMPLVAASDGALLKATP